MREFPQENNFKMHWGVCGGKPITKNKTTES